MYRIPYLNSPGFGRFQIHFFPVAELARVWTCAWKLIRSLATSATGDWEEGRSLREVLSDFDGLANFLEEVLATGL